MNVLKQFGILIFISFLGEVISEFFHLIIPGNVIGFILLFFALFFKIIKSEDINMATSVILINLAFFFIPAAASLLTILDLLKSVWIQLLVICTVSTVITIGVTGWIVEFILGRGDKNDTGTNI